ncbi:nucleotidyltransferase family protein [Parabacteroides sp. Marseille-P3160]|uniref:nucleotidyltransferase family protein n=1 Tax=Parabacteroides sp. Marseille-P3160 TaxID=1917887 RepID=UPI0009BC31F3|nr:nucleotidyltransferase family protein [Parabacteroides sp. Marseille-P3160]
MKAMIFAAGLGSRLKPMTDTCPKALLPVAGKPMLEHVILKLKAAGFDKLVINIHHFGEQILDFLNANQHFGLHIDISDERDYLLDTGGGLKKAQPFLQGEEPFLVHNVDIFSTLDLGEFYRSHLEQQSLATLLVSRRVTSRYLLFNEKDELCGWRNRDTGEVKSHYPHFDPSQYAEYAFGGIHVISPRIFRLMEEWTGKFSIINFYLSVCAKESIRAFAKEELSIIDLGKPETIIEAEKWMQENVRP